jgi:hypothetical protein
MRFSRLGSEVDPRDDLDPDDERDDPVDGGAERWPPSGAGDELAALLPRVLDPVGREPKASSHADPVTPAAATTTNAIATLHSTTMILVRPSATAKPM